MSSSGPTQGASSGAPVGERAGSPTASDSDDSARPKAASDSPEVEAAQHEEEDSDFGEFVYSGKDVRKDLGTDGGEQVGVDPQRLPLPADDATSDADTGGGARSPLEAIREEHRVNGVVEPSPLGEERGLLRSSTDIASPRGITAPPRAPSSRITSGSNDEFPTLRARRAGPTRARSSFGSIHSATVATPQRPPAHPAFSRLRSISSQSFPSLPSHSRVVSTSSYNTALEYPTRPPFGGSPSTSALDNISRRSSTTNLLELPSASDLHVGGTGTPASDSSSLIGADGPRDEVASPVRRPPRQRAIKWSPLKRLSARLYPLPGASAAAELMAQSALGQPTAMAVNGLVALGTNKGWVLVFDFAQNLRCVCGTEAIAREAGAVTAITVSQDHTFVGVGHETGHIHLYALIKPAQPARSVPPVELQQVLAGRKEGHLIDSKILHLGFVGARHTAIVSSDDRGLAFYHSLGKVLMLASTDTIRMLGQYPDPTSVLAKSPASPPGQRPRLATAATSPAAVVSPPDSPAATPHGFTRPLPSLAAPISVPHAGRLHPAPPVKKPSIILDMAPLPLGPAPHPPTDGLSLIALLTPTKLVVVGLRPSPRTWYRCSFSEESSDAGQDRRGFATRGVLAWWPSAKQASPEAPQAHSAHDTEPKQEVEEPAEDPLLIWAWGSRVRLLCVKGAKGGAPPPAKRTPAGALKPLPPPPESVDFEPLVGWDCEAPVLGLKWYSERVVVIMTPHHFDVYNIATRQRIGRDSFDLTQVISAASYSAAFDPALPIGETVSYATSLAIFKRKLFLLGSADVRVGAILSWADRVLALMQPGTMLDAIDTTTTYLQGQVDSSTISLPDDPSARRDVLEPKLREILNASLEFAFSDERLRDGSHSDGETIQRLFEGLVGSCVRACLALNDPDWLFDELFERYEQNGIEGIFLDRIEPFVLAGTVHALPPSVSQRLIAIHAERKQLDAVQRIIFSVDPKNLDLNQVLGLCQRENLYDALIHVHTRALHDYVTPLIELTELVRRIQEHRTQRPRRIGGENGGSEGLDADDSEDDDVERSFEDHSGVWRNVTKADQDVEGTVPQAYKVFAYLSHELVGQSYPVGDALPHEEAVRARNAIYEFLMSEATRSWPSQGPGIVIPPANDHSTSEPSYPYLRLLLHFDAEAMLDTLDLAFEDPYLDEDDDYGDLVPQASRQQATRQRIVELLLEIMNPPSRDDDDGDTFSLADRTFLHIFVARNIPKYPQFIKLPATTLRDILVSLATDTDQSTVEDRQLAAEYLLSTYTPADSDTFIPLFERAGFFRILRSIYRGERRWAALAATYLADPDIGSSVFGSLRETLKLASRATSKQKAELVVTILEAIPTLVEADEMGLQQTAELVDAYLPSRHSDVVDRLASPWRAFAYLRCLLEPAYAGLVESPISPSERVSSTHVDIALRHRYLSLLSVHEPQHVTRYLQADAQRLAQDPEVLHICEAAECFDALVWILDKNGEPEAALTRASEALETRTDLLLQRLLEPSAPDEDESDGAMADHSADAVLAQVVAVSKAAIAVCVHRTTSRRRPKDPPAEDLWFRLLSSLVATVRTVRAVAPAPTKKMASHRRFSTASIIVRDDDDEPQPLTARSSEILSALIPTALSALVTTTSSHQVSFPRLMRRLIESNARSPAANRSYAEFKAIVTSMLDTYAFEGDILKLSSIISAQDLFEHVNAFKRERERGWRPGGDNPSGACSECLQPVWGPHGAGTSPAMSRSASVSLVIESLGMNDRPRLKKRPSLKGKEVDWPDPPAATSSLPSGFHTPVQPEHEPPRGVVVGRDGRLFHQTCHLLRSGD